MLKKLVFDTSKLTMFSALFKVVSLITFVLLADRLDARAFGQFSYFVLLSLIFSLVAEIGLGQSLQAKKAKDISQDIDQVFSLRVMIYLACLPLIVFLGLFFGKFSVFQLFLLCVNILAESIINLEDSVYLSHSQSDRLSLKLAIKALLPFGLILLVGSMLSLSWAMAAFTLTSLTLLAVYTQAIKRHWGLVKLSEGLKIIRSGLKYGLLNLTGSIYSRADSLLVALLLGTSALGQYSLAYRFLDAAAMLPTNLGQLLFSRSFKSEWNLSRLKVMSLSMFGLGLGVALSVNMVSYFIFEFFLKDSYQTAKVVIQILSIAIVLNFLNSPLHTTLQSSNWLKKFLPFGMLNTLLNIILNIIFLPIYGVVAAAAVLVISEFTGLLLNLWYVRKYIELSLKL